MQSNDEITRAVNGFPVKTQRTAQASRLAEISFIFALLCGFA